MNPLQSRKQLLIAESELNRAHLSGDWQAMDYDFRGLARQTKTIAAWTASAAVGVAGLAAILRGISPRAAQAKSSCFKKILPGARLASELWFAFRAQRNKPANPAN